MGRLEWEATTDNERTRLYEQAGHAYGEIQKQLGFLKLMEAENFMTLVNAKRSLYSGTIFGFGTFDEIVRDSQSWIERVQKKEVRKNAKDDQHSSYKMLMTGIKNATGIKIKEITRIRLYGYESYNYEIRFVDKEHGLKLELIVPNVKSQQFRLGIFDAKDAISKEQCASILNDLELRLCYIAVEEKNFTKVERIRNFPSDTYDISDFKKHLDEFAERMKRDKEDCK